MAALPPLSLMAAVCGGQRLTSSSSIAEQPAPYILRQSPGDTLLVATYPEIIPMAKAKSALIKSGSGYTRTKLVAHLAAKAEASGTEISKKAVSALLEELVAVILANASVGAPIPGLGKAVIRKIKARPARVGRNPATGEEIQIKAKPAGKKIVFRFAKVVKDSIK